MNLNCQPDNTQLGDLTPEQECTDCNQPDGSCNCTMDDIIWSAAITQCMVNLGLATGQTLTQQLTIVYNQLCAGSNPTHVPCANVDVPGSYPNMNYVGSEFTGTYLNVLPGDFPNDYGIIINGITHDFGSTPDQATFLASLNALALATFAYVGNNLVGTGYVVFGDVLKAGGDDGRITPTNVPTDNKKMLCDFAAATNTEFGVINTQITTIQSKTTSVLYTNITPVSQDNAIGNLHGFGIPINALQNNGDTLIVDFCIVKNDDDGPEDSPAAIFYVGSAGNFIALGIPAGSSTLYGKYKIVRISATTVLCYGEYSLSIPNEGQGGMGRIINAQVMNTPNMNGSPWTVADLTGNIVDIQLKVTVPGGAKMTSTFLTVDKLSA